ncbi:MAG: carbamoyl phosphate synthase small subunit [Oscillospiraceae bacterium]|nr:carbamoyl phosphate synthase small subunit [Oscillospiraceae bacterium]
MNKTTDKAWLILADGTVYEGKSVGAAGTVYGELVCTTGMTGFQESLTDQSYYGQILAQTFPLMGNYGINNYDENTRVWVNGYVMREHCENPSNFRSQMGLEEFLKKQNTVGIYGVDTRALTRKVRTNGAMNCAITTEFPGDLSALLGEIREYKIEMTAPDSPPEIFGEDGFERTVVLYDYGVKDDMIKSLVSRRCKVVSVSPGTSVDGAMMKYAPDGFFIADGAGDPADYAAYLNIVRDIMASNKPVIGIGLGHQLMAMALGARVEKMKYGHRGANQPVLDVKLDKVFISTQNHGYTVCPDSVTENVGAVSHKNVNDGTCEGIRYAPGNAASLQYNPEPSSGPPDTKYFYDDFIDCMK